MSLREQLGQVSVSATDFQNVLGPKLVDEVIGRSGVLMYMRAPPEISEMGLLKGNQTADSVRLKLVKSLYGAKQSGRNWHQEASTTLKDVLNYRQCDKDPCVFYKANASWADEGPSEIFILYVDDFLYLGRKKSFDEFMQAMKRVYDITASNCDQKIKIWKSPGPTMERFPSRK